MGTLNAPRVKELETLILSECVRPTTPGGIYPSPEGMAYLLELAGLDFSRAMTILLDV